MSKILIGKVKDIDGEEMTLPFPNISDPYALTYTEDDLFSKAFRIYFQYYPSETEYYNDGFIPQILYSVEKCFFKYAKCDYNLIPVMVDDEANIRTVVDILRDRLTVEIDKYNYLFIKAKTLYLQELEMNRKLKIDTNKTLSDDTTITETKVGDDVRVKSEKIEYGNTISGNSDTGSVNEISPINSTIPEVSINGDIQQIIGINTPNNKNVSKFNSTTSKEGEDNNTINDKITYDTKKEEIVDGSKSDITDDTHIETSPEYFNIVMKIYEKYNVPKVIEKICNSVILEYNQSL